MIHLDNINTTFTSSINEKYPVKLSLDIYLDWNKYNEFKMIGDPYALLNFKLLYEHLDFSNYKLVESGDCLILIEKDTGYKTIVRRGPYEHYDRALGVTYLFIKYLCYKHGMQKEYNKICEFVQQIDDIQNNELIWLTGILIGMIGMDNYLNHVADLCSSHLNE